MTYYSEHAAQQRIDFNSLFYKIISARCKVNRTENPTEICIELTNLVKAYIHKYAAGASPLLWEVWAGNGRKCTYLSSTEPSDGVIKEAIRNFGTHSYLCSLTGALAKI